MKTPIQQYWKEYKTSFTPAHHYAEMCTLLHYPLHGVTDIWMRWPFKSDEELGGFGESAGCAERPILSDSWDEWERFGLQGLHTSPVSLALLFLLDLAGVVLVGLGLLVLLQLSHVTLFVLLRLIEIALAAQRERQGESLCLLSSILVK